MDKEKNNTYFRNYMRNRRHSDENFRIKQLTATKRWQEQNRYRVLANRTIHNHKSHGVILLCSRQEIENILRETTNCSICNAKLDFGVKIKGIITSTSPSIDIIDRTKPLTIENIQVLCAHCNMAKYEMNMDEFKEWVKMLYSSFFEHGQI